MDTSPTTELRSGVERLTSPPQEELGFAQHAYTVALAAGVVWAAALTAYTLFDRAGAPRSGAGPLWLLVFCGVVALPIAFMLLSAYAIRQGARLALETQRARAMASELVGPAAMAAAGAGDALETVRTEIARAAAAATSAGETLTTLRESLSGETERLTRAAAEANRATGRLTAAFSRERERMDDMTGALDAGAQSIIAAIAQQSDAVTEAAEVARARAAQAHAEIADQAASLSTAIDGAAGAAVAAVETLAGQTDRLERAGAFLGERYRGLDATLEDRHRALLGLTEALREEQDHAAVLLEGQRSRLVQAAADARASAEVVTGAAQDSGAALSALEGRAVEQARIIAAGVREQHEALRLGAEQDLSALQAGVVAAREAAEAEAQFALNRLAVSTEAARAGAAKRIEQAEREAGERIRAELEQLGEAGRLTRTQAAEAAQSSIAEVRQAIEGATALAEAASHRAGERMASGLEAARAAALEVDQLLTGIEARVAALPETVRRQAEAAGDAIAQMLDKADASGRGPTEAIRPSATPSTSLHTTPDRAASVAPATVAGSPKANEGASAAEHSELFAAQPMAQSTGQSTAQPPRKAAPSVPEASATREPAPASAEAAGLRPRLKLAPTDAPPAREAPDIFEDAKDVDAPILFDRTIRAEPSPYPPQHAPARDLDDWTWKDLLDTVDDNPVRDDDSLAEGLRAEIQAMGVDATALLPTSRIDEITAAIQSGDAGAVRDLVSRAAPAAIRRLSRRVLTDKVLRAQADHHVKHYEHLVSDAARRDREGHMTSALLGSEPGRTYLLLDAAFRELH